MNHRHFAGLLAIFISVAALLPGCGGGGDSGQSSAKSNPSTGASTPLSPNRSKPSVFSYVDASNTTQALKTSENAAQDGKAYQIRLSTDDFYALRVGDVFDLVLPSFGSVKARITLRDEQLGKVVSLAGEIVDQSGSSVRLSGSGTGISGSITLGETQWTIRSTAAGSTIQNESAAGMKGLSSHTPADFQKFLEQSQKLKQIPELKLETLPSSPKSYSSSPVSSINPENNIQAVPASASAPVVIDVLLVSDRSYQNLMGSESNELADIGNIITFANKALTDSQVFLRYRAVGYTRLTADATNVDHFTLLDNLSAGTGMFSGVWPARVLTGADVTVALSSFNPAKGNVCGLAPVGTFDGAGIFYHSNAFSAVASVSRGSRASDRRFCEDLAFAHELGHNLGSMHDRANSSYSGAYSYSYGYGLNGVFGDIMSYLSPRFPYFSNPNIFSCAGRACGTTLDNAALTFNNTAPLMAAANEPDNRLSGWYYDANQSGTGWAIEVANGRMFAGGFIYRTDGQPTWVVGYGAPCTAKPSSWCLGLDEYQGGQTLTGPYRQARVARRVANVEMTFGASYPASLTLAVDGVQRNLQRYAFENSAFNAKASFPGATLPGWYFNPSTPGTGVFTERQGDQIFAAYFYYRDDGTPTWSVVNGKNWLPSGTSFSANPLSFIRYANGQSLLGAYRMPVVVASDANTYLTVDNGGYFSVFNNSSSRTERWSKFNF